jgi:hypothetical protein
LHKNFEQYLNALVGDAVVVAALGDGRVVELVAGEVDLGQVMHQWKFTGCAPGNIDAQQDQM